MKKWIGYAVENWKTAVFVAGMVIIPGGLVVLAGTALLACLKGEDDGQGTVGEPVVQTEGGCGDQQSGGEGDS